MRIVRIFIAKSQIVLSNALLIILLIHTPAYALKVVEIEGTGATHRKAVMDGLRTVVEQVLGVFLTSRSQITNAALQYDVVSTDSTGFIKSYTINSCRNTKKEVICSLKVEVESDDQKIADYLRKLLANKIVSISITGTVDQRPIEANAISDAFAKEMINIGYYIAYEQPQGRGTTPIQSSGTTPIHDGVVAPPIGVVVPPRPFYHIKGTVDADEAKSQYTDSSLVFVSLSNMRLSLVDRNNMEIATFTSSDIKNCIGSGNNLRGATINLFSCIANEVGKKFIPIIKSKI